MNRAWIVIVALASAATAAGCGSTQRREPLTHHLRNFNESVRWQQYDKAAINVPVLEREDYLDEHEELAEDLRINDFEIKRMRFRNERQMARVDVEWSWHLDSRGIVHKTVTRQIWQVVGKMWLITRETRLRGEPMPGVDEPDEDDDDAEEVTQKTGPRRKFAE
jgi:hypothetical protein